MHHSVENDFKWSGALNNPKINTYKTKLKLDKEVGGGGGISERSREPNDKTRGTGERPESTSGPLGASATDRGGDQRENERTAREHGRNQRATLHDVALICWTLQFRFYLF